MGILGDAAQGVTPKLAESAAQAGAPPPGGAAPGGGAPPPAAAGPAPGGPAPAPAPAPAPGGGGQDPQVQQMAQQAIEAAKGGGGAPAPGGPAPGAPAPGGPAPGGPAPGGAPAPGGGGGAQAVDPGAEAVDGTLPASMQEEKATPEEQKEYERAMQALAQLLYSNPEIANSIVDQIDPDDKVSSTSKVSMLLIQQLDKKIQLDEGVVAEVTKETVGRIMELAEARHGIEYGGREAQVIMGSTWEGIQKMFGMEKQDAEALMAGVGGEGIAHLKQQHEGFMNG